MANRTDSYSLSPTIRRVADAFQRVGWISFWAQLVPGVTSLLFLAVAAISLATPIANPTSTVPGAPVYTRSSIGFGLFFVIAGLVALAVAIIWSFFYVRLARQLRRSNAQQRPKRADVARALRMGLIISLTGMLLALIGAQATVGPLVEKSFRQFAVNSFGQVQLQLISASETCAVQASTTTVLAHFVGLIATLWLTRTMNRQ